MKKDAFVKHTGFLTTFYVIGIITFTYLLQYDVITSTTGAIILRLMAFISLLLAVYYTKQTICLECKAVYSTMLILIGFMTFILISTAIVLLARG